MKSSCPVCGYPFQGGEAFCPECGNKFDWPIQDQNPKVQFLKTHSSDSVENFSLQKNDFKNIDIANYIYECWVIAWKSFLKLCHFNGRASRREYWSYFLMTSVICIIPLVGWILWLLGLWGVSVRRMHDINRSGWWILVPFQSFFMYLKKSDESENDYGIPEPATDLLY